MDSKLNCRECGKTCANDVALHRHLKRHKLSQKDYYLKHFPRYDKFDGTPIVFKNKNFYFENDFNSRSNLRRWLSSVSSSEAQDYIRRFLMARKVNRHLIYTPSQVELRSLMIPGVIYMDQLFGGLGTYYTECEALGFQNKFHNQHFQVDLFNKFSSSHYIIIDTREQKPLSFGIKTKQHVLNFGDYQLNDNAFTHNCCIERKSLSDFYGTLSSGFDRFCREIERAQEAGFYLVVLVEGLMDEVYSFSYFLRKFNVRLSPEYIMHNMRAICQKYPCVQFLFVSNRSKASDVIVTLFTSNGQYKQIDLQYAYDTGNL